MTAARTMSAAQRAVRTPLMPSDNSAVSRTDRSGVGFLPAMSLHLDRIDLTTMVETGENPYLVGPYAPTRDELTLRDLDVVGEIPDDLNGVYVRNGPNPQYEPQGRYHWFDVD